jgi:hypothetical protein
VESADQAPEMADDAEIADDADAAADNAAEAEQLRFSVRRPADPWMGIDSLMPVLLFVGLNSFVGLTWAIAGATAWSVFAAIRRRRQNLPIGKLLPIVTLFIVARGIVGIITDSEAVYFGIGIATKFGVGLGLLGSVVIGRNLLGHFAPYVFGFDEELQENPIYKSTMAQLTVIAAFYYFISAGFDIWLFNNSSANGYVVIRAVVNWPFAMATIGLCSWWAHVRFKRIEGFPGLFNLFEQYLEIQQDALLNRKRQSTT